VALKTRVDLFDSKGKRLKSTLFSKASSFHLYIKKGEKYVRITEKRIDFLHPRDPVWFKKDIVDTFWQAFDKAFVPETQKTRIAKEKPTKGKLAKVIRKEGPLLGDIVLGYPPLDPPRKVDRRERMIIRGQARLKLQEEFGIHGVEAEAIVQAMFAAFGKNIPLIPKMMEEFMVVYYLHNKDDNKAHVKRLLAGREVTTQISERMFLKGQLSQIDTLLKLSLIKVEKEVERKDKKTGEIWEELITTDHMFAKVIATYRGNMEMSVDDLSGGAWRDEVFHTVILDVLNVFQGFVDNGVFEYSKRPEYIIRIICPLFDKSRGVHESLKTITGDKRYGLGISLDRTFFESLEDVNEHLLATDSDSLKTPELDKTSLFDRVKGRVREYLRINNLNTFAITGFTIERLIWD